MKSFYRTWTLIVVMGLFGSKLAAQNLPVLSFTEFESKLKTNKHNLLVVNFWATWCKPCIAELPHLQRVDSAYKAKGVHLLLASMDFPNQFETRVKPFVQKRIRHGEVIAVPDMANNLNAYINRISKDWSGSIPATVLVDKTGTIVAFHEGEFTYETLTQFIEPHLK
jgi:thiol-disulfide isomerase/thioredoxin